MVLRARRRDQSSVSVSSCVCSVSEVDWNSTILLVLCSSPVIPLSAITLPPGAFHGKYVSRCVAPDLCVSFECSGLSLVVIVRGR